MNRLLLLIDRLARCDRRFQKPSVYLKIIGVLVSLALIGLIVTVVLLAILPKNFPIPDDATWLYQHQKSQTKLTGDQQIGGGYVFVFDGRDLWLRFRVKEASLPVTPQDSTVCNPNELVEIRQWFLENVRDRSGFFSALNLRTNLSERDLQSLNNLRCFKSGAINNKLGQEPTSAGLWMLYNSKTRLLYLRYADYG
ncbi:MAG: hypothetical protein LH660_17910 [Phormidesmis sp. CAN_BIN36]|nr:hypothetical protein [Phormidesmis sp. CAN_BIN36]